MTNTRQDSALSGAHYPVSDYSCNLINVIHFFAAYTNLFHRRELTDQAQDNILYQLLTVCNSSEWQHSTSPFQSFKTMLSHTGVILI